MYKDVSDYESSGQLRAYKMVQITDIWGHTRMRKVSLGSTFANMEKAKELVNMVREADSDPGSIGANLIINL